MSTRGFCQQIKKILISDPSLVVFLMLLFCSGYIKEVITTYDTSDKANATKST